MRISDWSSDVCSSDLLGADRLREILVGGVAEVADFLVAGGWWAFGAVLIAIGGADQREIALIRHSEEDADVGELEEIGEAVIEQFGHDDVRAADEAHPPCGRQVGVRSAEHTSE